MKRCPKCQRSYDDDTLRFCLDDGSPLFDSRDSEAPATEILPSRGAPTLKSSAPTVPTYPSGGVAARVEPEGRSSNPVLTLGVIAIVVLLVALVGITAVFVFRQSGTERAETNQNNRQSGTATTPRTPDKDEPANNSATNTSESPSDQSGPLKITASASSIRLAVQANTYYASNAIDGKRSTAWIEGVDGPGLGEWIRFDFDREILLHRILWQPGYFKSPMIWAENNRLATVTAYFSDGTSRDISFDDRMDSQKIDIGAVRTKWVRFVIKSVYYGTDPDTALSEVAFEWEP